MAGDRSLSVTFVRGARSVTGANFLFEAREGSTVTRILVDCGLTQGETWCSDANNEAFPYDPASIDALVVTHAHADHIGLIPKLVKDGFIGPVYATAPTISLMPVMLEDSAKIMALDAARCGVPAPYVAEDVAPALIRTSAFEYGEERKVGPFTVTLGNAGHILGSATVLLEIWSTRILVTGDLGRTPAILMPDPSEPPQADYLVTESVYGDRNHESADKAVSVLTHAVADTQRRKGTLLVPSFSLERTQIILNALKDSPIPVYLDSPLAEKVTAVYNSFPEYLRSPVTWSTEALPDDAPDPKVIVAGSGMSAGGRIRSHEKHYLPQKNATLFLVGYQVPGSLGRRLKDGARKVKIDGEWVAVRAKVVATSGFSAHADRDNLVAFAEKVRPKKTFVVLGEMSSSTFLAQRLSGFLGVETYIPQKGERIELTIND